MEFKLSEKLERTSPKARDAYIAKIQKRVGFAKGTWINAAKAIGGRVRGSVQWVIPFSLIK